MDDDAVADYLDRKFRPEGECEIWTGPLDRNGYGKVVIGGKQTVPHRVAWALDHGQIPEGYEIDHLCGRRACIRIDHLEAVSRAENRARMRGKRKVTATPRGKRWVVRWWDYSVTPPANRRPSFATEQEAVAFAESKLHGYPRS